jgi:virulence-associated protein VapD
MESGKCFKAFNFDLDTEKLKEHHPSGEKSYTKAYRDIERFFDEKQFEHRQGSGYCSTDKVTSLDVFDVIEELRDKLPWIDKCVKKIDVTDVGDIHDLTYLFKDDGEQSIDDVPKIKNEASRPKSMKTWKEEIENMRIGANGTAAKSGRKTEKER